MITSYWSVKVFTLKSSLLYGNTLRALLDLLDSDYCVLSVQVQVFSGSLEDNYYKR